VLLPPLGYTAFMMPGLQALRDLGLPMYTTLVLWTVGLLAPRPADRSPRPEQAVPQAA
jgi:hypothetical protein